MLTDILKAYYINTGTKVVSAHVQVGIKDERKSKNIYSLKFHLKIQLHRKVLNNWNSNKLCHLVNYSLEC